MKPTLKFVHHGDFKNTESFLSKLKGKIVTKILDPYGQKGVEALAAATPVRTGKTAASWVYKIDTTSKYIAIVWSNTNKVKGYPIAFLLQYGHGTRGGGFVPGRDYINPAMKPVFDEIVKSVWWRILSKK